MTLTRNIVFKDRTKTRMLCTAIIQHQPGRPGQWTSIRKTILSGISIGP